MATGAEQLAKNGTPAEECKLEAWYMDSSDEDQRQPHRLTPNKPCPPETLRDLGVLFWRLDADDYENDQLYQTIRKVRGYDYEDLVNIHPDTLPDYEKKIRAFYEEHIHEDEEIRFVVDGSGYFDVRDKDDAWIRIDCRKGDMIVLPAGIYHRFTLDASNYVKALRLFVGVPVWTPINRPCDEHPARVQYVAQQGITA
ncbi:unnamed protein product [Pedinophyceae sp. YPF-701]|nr:unnamed protein product [Pedinophyceae sp. YPF-701]